MKSESTQLFPPWKNAVSKVQESVKDDPELQITDAELVELFDAEYDSREYRFALLQFRETLKKSGISLLRIRNQGYKVANDSEKVNIITEQFHRRYMKSLSGLQLVLQSVKVDNLTVEERDRWTRWVVKGAMITAYEKQLPLNRVEPTLATNFDLPKLIIVPANKGNE
jgi:hypothetical protein